VIACAPTFIHCVFSDNVAYGGSGGGIACRYSAGPIFDHCVFAGNLANGLDRGGGGMAVRGSSLAELTNCTFFGNRARGTDVAGGILCVESSSVLLDNCIVAFSEEGYALSWDESGVEPVLTCCDVYGNANGDWVGSIADQYGINGNIWEDPLFCDPSNYDFYLCSNSPCLDADTCGTIGAFGQGCGTCTSYVLWTDVTTDILGDAGAGAGFAWVDYDNDDDLDIFVTNGTSENRLYRNDSLTAKGFVEATPRILADPADSRGAAWGDYDNDGDLDLYVSNDGPNRLFRNRGNEKFQDVTRSPLDDSGIGQTVSWADYDNDGDLDLYLVNDGPNKLFRNDGAGDFTDVTSGALADSGRGMGVGWADYDDDGDQDIYVANYGINVLLENQGDDVFVDATTDVLRVPFASAGVAWGDYDNDGDLDLYVANAGYNKLLRNDGGIFTDVTIPPLDDVYVGRSVA
jgi:hypothetical protein